MSLAEREVLLVLVFIVCVLVGYLVADTLAAIRQLALRRPPSASPEAAVSGELARCAFCTTVLLDVDWEAVKQARFSGDPIYCDAACRTAGTADLELRLSYPMPYANPPDPKPEAPKHCRHRMGANVEGRCIACGVPIS